jgi:uncharacterized protein
MVYVIVLIGESGSGKSSVEKILMTKGFNKIVSVTTRMPRIGEIDGVDYHFITQEQFNDYLRNKELAENVSYNGNSYGIRKKDCKDNSVVAVEPGGLKQLIAQKDLNVKSVYLNAPENFRALNMLKRGDQFNSVVNRIYNDRSHFLGIEKLTDYSVPSEKTEDLETIALFVLEVAKKESGQTIELRKRKDFRDDSFIMTNNGVLVNVFDLKEGNILIEDVAHALSNICRWNGHSKFHYSVAQHSIMVSKQMKELGFSAMNQLFGLLHDGSEAYICDIPKPVKANLPDYIELEKKVQGFVYKELIGRSPNQSEKNLLNIVDTDVLYKEANEITNHSGAWFDKIPSVKLEVKKEEMKDVEQEFLSIYYQLLKEARDSGDI